MARNEKVLNCLYRKPDAIFKLVCFPWAGSGSVYFAKWGQNIHDPMEVHSVRLPGRENRLDEPWAKNISQVVDEVVCALLPLLQDKPFAFFGHSLGSYIAFETVLQLKEKHNLEPMHLFVSSAVPPQDKLKQPITTDLSEEEISTQLLVLGGTPKNVIEDKELLQLYVSKLKEDAQLFYTYKYDKPPKPSLSCDITCFMGAEDTMNMEAWKDLTSGSSDIHMLPGDHFYLMEPANENFIKNYITKCLELSMIACV